MKKFLLPLLALQLGASPLVAGNWFGPGPFAMDGYWPGFLNGKYTAVVTGENISGVLGFGINDGSPPFRENEQQSTSGGLAPVALVNTSFTPDPAQNYFAIFVEGIVYTGTTWAGVDLQNSTVAGALQGAGLTVGAPAALVNDVSDALNIVNRGLSGGFNATIDSKQSMSFSGTGQLSCPAFGQEIVITAVPEAAGGGGSVPAGTITNETISGVVLTDFVDFTLRGIRTSFFSSNPLEQAAQVPQ